jgi:dTDP-4-dehydrorhamnose 3,5-epimerase/CDP-3, 6-dideoxy-D-glycero-D-glycero-4-hexulose-5-epimerase
MSFIDLPNNSFKGVYIYSAKPYNDQRGSFVKIYNQDIFAENKINIACEEEFYSISKANVLRGMHFQVPPYEAAKQIICISGKVLDVIVDLRQQEPTYKHVWSIELSASIPQILHLPVGIAHGFLSLQDDSVMLYRSSKVYSKEYDFGIKWNSIGYNWPISNPIISERDYKFPQLYDIPSYF